MSNFKYSAIVEWAKAQIREKRLNAGDHFYSENELCEIHHVSRQTVRQALHTLENESIIVRKRGSGTFVRTTDVARHGAGRVVGVVSTYFSDYIFPSIVTGVEQVLKQRGITMQLAITQNLVAEEARALRSMLEQDVCGLIIEPSKSALPNPNRELYDHIRARGIPVVFFNAKYAWSDAPCVAMDDVQAAYAATEHLFALGHRKIGAVLALDDMQGHKRYEGFMRCCLSHDVETAEQNVLWYATGERGELFTSSKERVEELLRRYTAILCYNDNMAVKLLAFCRERGLRVPDDISIIGIDDCKLGRVCEVPLTTLRHPHGAVGERAAQTLLRMIDQPSDPIGDTLFPPELIARSSTARRTEA